MTGISQHIDHIVNQKLTLRKVLMLILTGISQHIDHIVNQKSTFRNDSKTVCDSLHRKTDARWVKTVKICFHMICLCAYMPKYAHMPKYLLFYAHMHGTSWNSILDKWWIYTYIRIYPDPEIKIKTNDRYPDPESEIAQISCLRVDFQWCSVR